MNTIQSNLSEDQVKKLIADAHSQAVVAAGTAVASAQKGFQSVALYALHPSLEQGTEHIDVMVAIVGGNEAARLGQMLAGTLGWDKLEPNNLAVIAETVPAAPADTVVVPEKAPEAPAAPEVPKDAPAEE